MSGMTIRMTVNSDPCTAHVDPGSTLLDLLRDELELTGTKQGCGEGDCGACTVLLDGAPVSSCLVLALQADGREVLTVEGLAEKIVASGGRQRMPIREYYPGEKPYRMVYMEDPWGNIIELYSHSYELTYSAGAYQS